VARPHQHGVVGVGPVPAQLQRPGGAVGPGPVRHPPPVHRWALRGVRSVGPRMCPGTV